MTEKRNVGEIGGSMKKNDKEIGVNMTEKRNNEEIENGMTEKRNDGEIEDGTIENGEEDMKISCCEIIIGRLRQEGVP